MTTPNDWFSIGPLVAREQSLAIDRGLPLNANLAIATSGWEDRNLALTTALAVSADEGLVLDFEVLTNLKQRTSLQADSLKGYFGATPLKLQPSTQIDRNTHSIKTEIRRRFPNGFNTLFIDITTIPKGYFQALIGWLLMEGLVGQIHVGYCEGVYGDTLLTVPVDEGPVQYAPVKPLIGATGPCREKRLIVVLGKEKSSCYGLIEEMAPDYLHVIATRSAEHPELFTAVQDQVNRLQAVYGEQVVQISEVDAFSIRSLRDVIDTTLIESRTDIATTIFAAATKPLALAASLLGVAFKDRIEVRYRQKAAYDPRAVEIGRRYHLYTIVDLRSGRLAGCEIW